MSVKHVVISTVAALALMTGAASAAPVVFDYTGGFQSFTAGVTGVYDITAIGAQGGTGGDGGTGGLGAKVAGDFTLTKGEVLSILVGGRGQDGAGLDVSSLGAGGGGGGGGSYVLMQNTVISDTGSVNYSYVALATAGGGGGGSSGINGDAGQPGRIVSQGNSGAPVNNSNGGGGASTSGEGYGGAGGAGEYKRGEQTETGSFGGNPPYLATAGFFNGTSTGVAPYGQGGGGTAMGEIGGNGGFGGGGGGGFGGGGGGGGFTGGFGGAIPPEGGGAGSFLADGTPVNRDFIELGGVNAGDGFVSIDFVPAVTGAVPEPSTWAMMLLGFSVLGFLGHRKSRKGDAVAMLAA